MARQQKAPGVPRQRRVTPSVRCQAPILRRHLPFRPVPINRSNLLYVIFLTVDGGLRATADSDLVARAAAGDGAAFHALVERHRALVYRLAYQFAGNHHDAEDITQDVFIKVYRSLDRFRYDAQLTSWL